MGSTNYRSFRLNATSKELAFVYYDKSYTPGIFQKVLYSYENFKLFQHHKSFNDHEIFIILLLDAIGSGAYFKSDNMMKKYQLIEKVFESMDRAKITFDDYYNASHSKNDETKYVQFIKKFTKENLDVISKFIK